MANKRMVTVKLAIYFSDMMMEDTEAGLDLIRGIVTEASTDCETEIKRALEDSGAKDVTFT